MKSLLRRVLIAAVASSCVALVSAQEAPKLLPFQGRLTDSNGNVVPDDSKVVQFKIYNAPVGGQAVWNGEVQMLTTNDGLVSTVLGSKVDLSRVDFDRTLYLELTIDANKDDQITAADPPMLPRQIILSSVFAKEAADSRNLAGRDWSSILFKGNDPQSGFIRGDKLQTNSITAAQIAPQTITAAQIANGTITSNQIAPGAIATAAVQDGSITHPKMASRAIGTNVPVGGVAISASCGDFSAPPSFPNYVDITNFSVTITSSGRPVVITLIPDGYTADNSPDGSGGFTQLSTAANADFMLFRESNPIAKSAFGFQASGFIQVWIPGGSLSFLDAPPSGNSKYQLRGKVDGKSLRVEIEATGL